MENSPDAPVYSDNENWAVLPNQWPDELNAVVTNFEEKKADVFYIYPTLFTDKKNSQWNAEGKLDFLCFGHVQNYLVLTRSLSNETKLTSSC